MHSRVHRVVRDREGTLHPMTWSQTPMLACLSLSIRSRTYPRISGLTKRYLLFGLLGLPESVKIL
jgi:hypothetical protein